MSFIELTSELRATLLVCERCDDGDDDDENEELLLEDDDERRP